MTTNGRPLGGKVALVAGATRGAGRGIAIELGAAGATVVCVGRSSRAVARPPRAEGASPFALAGRPETIEETAELVTAAGGVGVARRCDCSAPDEVADLCRAIGAEHGGLDLLVNDVWGGEELTEFGVPFWELDLAKGRALLERAVLTHAITARHAVPLLFGRGGGLVVEITDGASLYYRTTLFYDLAKIAVIRLAFAMAEELRPKGIAAIAVTPGFLRSEAMLEHLGVGEGDWRRAIEADPHFAFSETPRFVGRGVAALAADPGVMSYTGTLTSSWELARRYGHADVDGARPDWGAHCVGEEFAAEQARSHARFVAGCTPRVEPRGG